MIVLSPPLLKVDTRQMLLTLAEWEVAGLYDDLRSPALFADVIRVAAPALRDERDDTEVAAAFEELVTLVALVASLESGATHFCEVLTEEEARGDDPDGRALEAARARLELTLDELTTPTPKDAAA